MKLKMFALLALVINLYANEEYKGCGKNENEARLNLANNIYTQINSTTSLEKSSSSFFGFNIFNKTFKKTSNQTTNLSLKDIDIKKEDTQTCAFVKKDKLYSHTKRLISKVKKVKSNDLPNYEKDKVVKINEILTDLRNALALSEVFKDKIKSSTIYELKNKEKYFTNLRRKYNSQFVKVTILGSYDSLKIDGKNQKNNKEIFLKSGKHSLNILSQSHCDIEKSFKLEKNEDEEIVIDMDDYKFPYIIIDSNKSDAKLLIDGKRVKLGSKYTIEKCNNEKISYSISYGKDKETGVFEAVPSEKYTNTFTFYSQSEIREFNNLSNSYSKNNRLEVKYGYISTNISDDYDDFETLNSIQINHIKKIDAFKHGYGALIGLAENSSAYEVYYLAGFQLNSIGNNALRIGSVVFIPSISTQLGLGYHNLYNEKTNNETDTFSIGSNSEYKFLKDTFIARAEIGIDFIVNEDIGINIFTQKNFTMEKSLIFGAGLSFKF